MTYLEKGKKLKCHNCLTEILEMSRDATEGEIFTWYGMFIPLNGVELKPLKTIICPKCNTVQNAFYIGHKDSWK